ncbi:MAG: 2-C-methyl-D-erythritol 2,4-cyclodiphosphate synthase [Thermoanaerobaculia bacterium]
MSRVGLGFDAHPFEKGRTLVLGGLDWDFEAGLSGHSDGDVLLHSICDALLGAAGLGSLGEHFSDREEERRGRDSAEMLSAVAAMVRSAGWSIENLDATCLGQEPRIAPRGQEIKARISSILGISPERVSVRGTSTNGLGFPGRGEGLAAMAVVLLEPHPPAPSPAGEGVAKGRG